MGVQWAALLRKTVGMSDTKLEADTVVDYMEKRRQELGGLDGSHFLGLLRVSYTENEGGEGESLEDATKWIGSRYGRIPPPDFFVFDESRKEEEGVVVFRAYAYCIEPQDDPWVLPALDLYAELWMDLDGIDTMELELTLVDRHGNEEPFDLVGYWYSSHPDG